MLKISARLRSLLTRIVVGLAALAPAPAFANSPEPAGEPAAETLHWRAFTALRQAQTVSGKRPKSVSALTPFWDAVLHDGQITDDERIILARLADPQHPLIRLASVSPSGTAVELRFINQLNAEAADRAAALLRPQDDRQLRLEQLWRTSAETPAIYREFLTDADARAALATFLQTRAAQSWSASNKANGFGPIRDFIAEAYNRAQTGQPQLSPDEKRLAFRVLHDALAAYSATLPADQKPPEVLYTWIGNVAPKEHSPAKADYPEEERR